MNKKELLLVICLILIIGGYFISNNPTIIKNIPIKTITEIVKESQKEEDRTALTTGTVVEQAKELTKLECDPNTWKNWSDLTVEEREGIVGLAKGVEYGMLKNYTLTIDLHIDDKLTNQNEIEFTAWHECGHAKTYNITSDKAEELYNETLDSFSECKGYEEECLADSMAEVKTGIAPTHSYLGKPSTKKQLDTANKVWKTSGKVNHKNDRTEKMSWLEISS